MEAEEKLREQIDGFLTDLGSDITQYGLTDSIRESARAVFFQIIKEVGWIPVEPVQGDEGRLLTKEEMVEQIKRNTGKGGTAMYYATEASIVRLLRKQRDLTASIIKAQYEPVQLEVLGEEAKVICLCGSTRFTEEMLITHAKRLYPTIEEVQEQADYLSSVPEAIYKLFLRQGIPPAVACRIKRNKEATNETD